MIYSIPVNFKTIQRYKKFFNKIERQSEMFLFLDKDKKFLFVIVHGDEDNHSHVVLKNVSISIRMLMGYIAKEIKKQTNIRDIYTISCYGGCQPEITYEDFHVQSFHDSKEKIELLDTVWDLPDSDDGEEYSIDFSVK